jgi:hypothetical protein
MSRLSASSSILPKHHNRAHKIARVLQ